MQESMIAWQVAEYEKWIAADPGKWKWLHELGRMNWQAALDEARSGVPLPADYYTPEKMAEREAAAKARYPIPDERAAPADDSMVERVARALCDRAHESPINQRPCSKHGCDRRLGTGQECRFFGCARAAIEAMREPTPDIVQAGCNVSMEISAGQVFHAWQAMIDAALK